MAHSEGIVLAFGPFGKAAQSIVFPITGELVPAPGEDLMPVGLMSDVPYQLVIRRVENVMQCHCQLYHAQTGRKMPAMDAHRINNKLPELVAELLQLLPAQFLEVGRGIDGMEQGARGDFHSFYLLSVQIYKKPDEVRFAILPRQGRKIADIYGVEAKNYFF